MCSFLTFFIHSSPFLSVNDMSNICALLGSDSGLFMWKDWREKKSFLLNLIIASAEQGFEVFLSIAEKQQQEHGGTAKMSKDAKFRRKMYQH